MVTQYTFNKYLIILQSLLTWWRVVAMTYMEAFKLRCSYLSIAELVLTKEFLLLNLILEERSILLLLLVNSGGLHMEKEG